MRKLRDYCLNPDHRRDKHKARVFASALGLTNEDAPALRRVLLRAAQSEEAKQARTDEYGTRYVLDFDMSSLSGIVQRLGNRLYDARNAFMHGNPITPACCDHCCANQMPHRYL